MNDTATHSASPLVPPRPRGRLKIYLGYAAGVGKTFQMLRDAHDAQRRAIDVVVGYFETHKRQDTLALAESLEVVPRRILPYRDRSFEEMDTDAILARKPQLCLVDEFAHTNVPGSPRAKRWEDVLVLLDSGIDVWTTLNVQHIESLNDDVAEITGVRVRETVPDWVLKQAAEVQFIDTTPEALLNRLKRGAVYTADMQRNAVERFFRESNLRALRDLAIREAAHEVQARQDAFVDVTQTSQSLSAGSLRDRVLVVVTSDPASASLIRRGRRMADYLGGDCLAVFVHLSESVTDLPPKEREAVEAHLNFARNLRIETRVLPAQKPAAAIVDFARRNRATHILFARPPKSARASHRVIRETISLSNDVQVIVAANTPTATRP